MEPELLVNMLVVVDAAGKFQQSCLLKEVAELNITENDVTLSTFQSDNSPLNAVAP